MENDNMDEEPQSDRSDRDYRNIEMLSLPRRRVPQSLFLSSGNNRDRRIFESLTRAQMLERQERERPAI